MPHLFTINPLDFNTLMYGNDDVVGLLYSMCLFTMDPSDLVIKRPHQCNIFPCISLNTLLSMLNLSSYGVIIMLPNQNVAGV